MLLPVVLQLLLRIAVLSVDKAKGHVVDDEKTCTVKRYPHFVLVINNRTCGGVLIHYRWVLTSVHCLQEKGKTVVRAGGINAYNHGHQMRTVVKSIVDQSSMPLTGSKMHHSLALLLMDRPFQPSASVAPAQVFVKNVSQACTNLKYVFVGGTPGGAPRFRCVRVQQTEAKTCPVNDEFLICVKEAKERAGPCYAALGGALMCGRVVVGMQSWGDCALATDPMAFTNVTQDVDFIEATASVKVEKVSSVGGARRLKEQREFLMGVVTVVIFIFAY